MSTQSNEALYRRLIDAVLNNGDLAVADNLVDACYVRHDAPGLPPGPRGFKERTAAVRDAFPDVHYTLEDVIAEDDRVASRWTAHGTHAGTFSGLGASANHPAFGIAPTGRMVTWQGIDFCRFAGGKLVESWSLPDRLGLLQQLGAASIYQLRIYEIFEHNKSAFHTRFRDHASRIMRRCGFDIAAMWEARTDQRTEFVYLLAWRDETAKNAAWAEFMADAEWEEIKRVTKAQHGDLVGAIEDRLLVPTSYSPALSRFS